VPGQIKTKTGQVVSDKMDKTIVVAVDNLIEHPLYKKRMRQRRKFHAHDETNEAHIGDIVRIGESRPISKTKTWRLLEIVRHADHTTATESGQ
jgi:small subunit ribosomal protein S17